MTHSSYLDVCELFIYLLRKNWPDCPYRIVCSIYGEDKKIANVECMYIGTNQIITDCIVEVAKKYESRFYMCFLGDAFISNTVTTAEVDRLINDLDRKSANYCNLTVNYFNKRILKNTIIYNLDYRENYGHSFVSFIATKKFIMEELHNVTDYEFEMKYQNSRSKNNDIFNDRYRVSSNIMNIFPTVEKGKWDRFALKKVRKYNPEINIGNRKVTSVIEQGYMLMKIILHEFLPSTITEKIKKFLSSIGFSFASKY